MASIRVLWISFCISWGWGWGLSVSYTHLDVYKRQVLAAGVDLPLAAQVAADGGDLPADDGHVGGEDGRGGDDGAVADDEVGEGGWLGHDFIVVPLGRAAKLSTIPNA